MGKRHISTRPPPVCILANRALHCTIQICDKAPKEGRDPGQGLQWPGPNPLFHSPPPTWTHSFQLSLTRRAPDCTACAWMATSGLAAKAAAWSSVRPHVRHFLLYPVPAAHVCVCVCLSVSSAASLLTTNSSSNPRQPPTSSPSGTSLCSPTVNGPTSPGSTISGPELTLWLSTSTVSIAVWGGSLCHG